MFMVFRKKQMVMTALVLMLGIAGYLNYRYDKEPEISTVSVDEIKSGEPDTGEAVMVNSEAADPAKEDFFAKQKLEKDRARAKKAEELGEILEEENISDEMRKSTEEELALMTEREEQEATAVNMLSAKGFEHTMVYITDENVTVNIKQKGISRSDTAKIVDIIYEVTKNNNIKIVEVE